MNSNLKLILKIIVPSAIFIIIILLLRGVHFDWNTFPRLACQLNGNCNDCEKDLDGSFVHEIVNTLSNVIYIIVGFYIYFKYTSLSKFYRGIILFGFCAIAIGSTFYHSSTSLPGIVSDFIGINILLTCLSYVVFRIKFKSKELTLGLLGIFISGFILLTVNFPENDLIKYIATGLISGILILSLFKYLLQRNMIIAVILYLLGVICWQIDGRRIFCDPLSILQFHSLWHICVALAGLFIVREVVRLGKGE